MFITQEQLAKRWNMSPRTLERWRTVSNEGPRFVRLGGGPRGLVRYREEDIIAWERAHTVDPTET
jgi:predicted DNA-binding transcriptional regulator AlpA